MKDFSKKNLIIIGGAEDKEGDKVILNFVADKLKELDGKLLIATIATECPNVVREQYKNIFSSLGIRDMEELHVTEREEAFNTKNLKLVEEASAIFFTGGDQLRITSLIGGTDLYYKLQQRSCEGCYFIGTSAGASVMSDIMIVGGEEEESPKKSTLNMSTGLGILKNTLIDQHFAQRGRIGRLLAGVSQNPEVLGIGIDEDTAIVINDDELTVIGSGAVYFVDGREISYTNVSEKQQDEVFSIFNVKLHVLTSGKKMNLLTRVPFEEERSRDEDK
ncbi:cyanophycinase [Clostridium sp. B9]|uniref:cyanophycinase n=1 Tax=Clostridium sp. B9 TaxID=3423224 RepID=UPI003D2EE8F1